MRFFAHEAIVSDSSGFFKKALEDDWAEGATRTVNLPDVCPSSFPIYVDWLYTGRFCLSAQHDMRPREDGAINDKEWGRWALCLELGDFLQDTSFKDALIDIAIEKMSYDDTYSLDVPNDIYRLTKADSPYRRLTLDIAVSMWDEEDFSGSIDQGYPIDFTADLLSAMGKKIREGVVNKSPREFFENVNACKYHEHTLTKTLCYKTKHRP